MDSYYCTYEHTPIHSLIEVINGREPFEVGTVRNNYSLCLQLYNHNNSCATSLNILDIESYFKTITFYPDKISPHDFFGYTRVDHVAATIMLRNKNIEQMTRDIQKIRKREYEGTLFI